MALLTLDERKAIYKELGLGAYNKENIKALQKKYMYRKSDWDGIYGQNTDNLLRTVYYTKIYTKNFSPKEFRCECGGKYCCGFPNYMKPAELIHIQKIRDHYGKPITITCGLRDKKYNASLGGSVQNSLHLKGQALDFYQSGVTDTLKNRKKSIKWIKAQPNHHYTYGDGINSNGYYVRAPYMGNALHTDTYDNVKPKHPTLKDTNTQATQNKPSTSVQKPSATTPVASKYKVIDVSVWQGDIDWKKVKADGVVGAIIRYADGASIDTKFEKNMKEAKANGLHVGSYIFSRAKNKEQAEREATRIFNACKPYAIDMPIYIDLEAKGLEKYADTVAPAFLNKIKSLGGKGGVYANLNWWNNYLTKTAKNYSASAFWIAQYYDKITHKNPSLFGMWQYSSSGKVNGISGKVDMDWCYKEYWKDAPKTDTEPTPTPTKKAYSGAYPSIKVTLKGSDVLAQKANEYAYPYTTDKAEKAKSKYPSGKPTKAYKEALDSLPYSEHKWDAGARSGANCDVFVWVGVLKGGIDKNFPSGLWRQLDYMLEHWKQVKTSEALPGDVYTYIKNTKEKKGHTGICYSNGYVKEASHETYYPRTNKALKTRLSMKGKKKVYVFRPPNVTRNYLCKGDSGDEIKKLQAYLNWYDPNNKLSVDGKFGNATDKAVKAMQKALKLTDDGMVGAKTIEAMKKVKK